MRVGGVKEAGPDQESEVGDVSGEDEELSVDGSCAVVTSV